MKEINKKKHPDAIIESPDFLTTLDVLKSRIKNKKAKEKINKLIGNTLFQDLSTWEQIADCFQTIFSIELALGYKDEDARLLCTNLKKSIELYGKHYERWMGKQATKKLFEEFKKLQEDLTMLIQIVQDTVDKETYIAIRAEWEQKREPLDEGTDSQSK